MKKILRSFYKFHVFFCLRILVLINRLGFVVFYQPIPELGIKVDPKRTDRALKRWEVIRKILPDEPMSVLDIGANAGFYSIKMARLKHFVTALDNKFFSIFIYFAKEALNITNLSSFDMLLDPDNVKTLPNYDCTLLLSVFHHWCKVYGKVHAIGMLDTIYEKTNRILFFETGQSDTASEKYKRVLPEMGESPEAWLHNYFKEKGCRRVETLGYIRARYLIVVYK